MISLPNKQKQEPESKADGRELEVVSIFHTLQGEGPFTGQAAIFIRLAGCNLQCPGCDTDYTTDRRRLDVKYIVYTVHKLRMAHVNTKLVVITGGEPLRQNLVPLIRALKDALFMHVQIESNGVIGPNSLLTELIHAGHVTYIVSPKTARISANAKDWASAFKYVISADSINPDDGLPIQALGHPAKPFIARPHEGYGGKIYINPCDEQDQERNQQNIEACRDSALRFGYTMGIQLHKLVDLP